MLSAVVLGLGACDVKGTQTDRDAQGPLLRVVSSNLETGVLAVDGTIELRFNRLLLPWQVNRQPISLRNAAGGVEGSPIITYDPVLRSVRISNPNPAGGAWLQANQPYKIVLQTPAPDGGNELFVLRAIDGAPLEGPAEIPFVASTVGPPPLPNPVMRFCDDVFSTFAKYCTQSCHDASTRPFQSLLLDTSQSIVRTAVGKVSTQMNTGASLRNPSPLGRVFGVDMPIIDPGNPGNSYLVYKMLLLAESNPELKPCFGFIPPLQLSLGDAGLLPRDERERLGDLLVGQPMPPYGFAPSLEEIERVSAWIAQGASVQECTGCLLLAPDAGPQDAGGGG